MNKRISVFAFAAALVLSAAVLRAGELRSTKGTVEVKKAGAATWTQGRPKTKVEDGDIVRTGVGSETELRLEGEHKLLLREKTALKVDSGKSPETKLNLLIGRVRSFVSKLKPTNKFEIKTPVAVASIRGTVFELEVGEDQSSRLSVLEGIVGYRDLAGIGQEVQVLKGQSVLIEAGAAPRPAEPLPQDLQQGLVPDRDQQDAKFDLKAEVQREAGLNSFKEFFQSDAAAEMKVAQYQEGKTMIDAFGNRVRLEEYIVRPSATQFSFVSLNTRDDRFDFTRFDLYAHSALPDDIGSINLFSGNTNGLTTQNNWVEKTHRLSSNGDDYYREWQTGGNPVNFTDGKQRVVFSDWYTEVRAGSAAPVLLSHWVPDAGFLGGNATVTRNRDLIDTTGKDVNGTTLGTGDNAQDIPSGYNDFGSGTIGDSRGVDSAGFTNAQRLDFFSNATVAGSYAASEGYTRTSKALYDDQAINLIGLTNAQANFILASTKLSRASNYTVPGGTNITLQVDQYFVNDEGDRLSFLGAATLGSNVQGINFQNVFTSSLTGNRKIDVVISPSIFKKAGLLDN